MKDVQTTLSVVPVLKEHLSLFWADASKVLEKSVATAKGKFKIKDILPRLTDGSMVLWVVIDPETTKVIAAITTRVIEYPQAKSLAMDWIGGTRMKDWLPMAQESISRYAKEHKCKYLEGYGRKGWDRWLRKYGWKLDYIAYKMELS